MAEEHDLGHRQSVCRYVEFMRANGIGPWESAPLAFRILWRCGCNVPPPAYLGRPSLIAVFSAAFALLFGTTVGTVLLLLELGLSIEAPWAYFAAIPLLAGLVFGVGMARRYATMTRDLRLPEWTHFCSEPDDGRQLNGQSVN